MVLLSPVGVVGLNGIGSIYGKEFEKIDIGKYRKDDMRTFLKNDKELFDKYALQDSLITLKHAIEMNDFFFTMGRIGVPLTLSGIGKTYVLKK